MVPYNAPDCTNITDLVKLIAHGSLSDLAVIGPLVVAVRPDANRVVLAALGPHGGGAPGGIDEAEAVALYSALVADLRELFRQVHASTSLVDFATTAAIDKAMRGDGAAGSA
jgi:hypothetical protein